MANFTVALVGTQKAVSLDANSYRVSADPPGSLYFFDETQSVLAVFNANAWVSVSLTGTLN